MLWTTSSSHHLQYILWTKFNPFPLFWRIYLCSFYYNCMCRKVHTPRKCTCWHQNRDKATREQVFHQISIASGESSMVNSKSVFKKLLQICAINLLLFQYIIKDSVLIRLLKLRQFILCICHVLYGVSSSDSFLSWMHKDNNLILIYTFYYFLIEYFIHKHHLPYCLLFGYAYKLLL